MFPTSDYPLHSAAMASWPLGDGAWPGRVRAWLETNAAFRAYVLTELSARGPLRSRDLEDRAAVSWRSSGWTDCRNVSQMLELLWARGEIAVADRVGSERLRDLAERVLPASVAAVPVDEARRVLARRRLRSLGVARPGDVGAAAGGVEVEVEGVPGPWVADPDLLERPFAGRTAALSPFDRLVYDRDRLLALFGFEYRLEISVPVARRRWGYYVLPILHGDRLVARADRRAGILRVPALHVEAGCGGGEFEAARGELRELADWLGLGEVVVERTLVSSD